MKEKPSRKLGSYLIVGALVTGIAAYKIVLKELWIFHREVRARVQDMRERERLRKGEPL